jgi:predicted kinase
LARVISVHTELYEKEDLTGTITDKDDYMSLLYLGNADCNGRFSLDETTRFASCNPVYTPTIDEDKPWVTLMVGVPGCGKSTHASKYGKVFSTDDTMENIARNEMGITGDYSDCFHAVSGANINWVSDNIERALSYSNNTSSDVVIDATNLVRKKRRGIVNRFKKTCNVRFVMLWRDFDDCKKSRDSQSGKYISDKVYHRMLAGFSYPTMKECDELEHILV